MKAMAMMVVVVVGCTEGTPPPETESETTSAVKRRDAAVDAYVSHDAYLGSTPGMVTCSSTVQPDGECTLSSAYCCFQTYSGNFGSCTPNGSGCAHNTEYCDGPEDCASGQTCYAHNWTNGDMWFWTIACAATPPGPTDAIMCRPSGDPCPSGLACVQANSVGYWDFMATQYVCH